MNLSQGHLVENLRTSLIEQWPQGGGWACMQFEPLKAKGLAHDHVRLLGTGWLARIPKQSQMQFKAPEDLNRDCSLGIGGHALELDGLKRVVPNS